MYDVAGAEGVMTDEAVRRLFRGVQRFHYASRQDADPVVAARHNGYAVALVDAVWDLSTPEQVRRATGEDLAAIRHEILAEQDRLEGLGLKALAWLKGKGIDLVELARKVKDDSIGHLEQPLFSAEAYWGMLALLGLSGASAITAGMALGTRRPAYWWASGLSGAAALGTFLWLKMKN